MVKKYHFHLNICLDVLALYLHLFQNKIIEMFLNYIVRPCKNKYTR